MLCNLRSKFNLEKILPHTIYLKMQPNTLLIWQKNYQKNGVTTTSMVAPVLMSQGESRNPQPGRSWRSHPPTSSTISGLRSPSPLIAVTTQTLFQSRGGILSLSAPIIKDVKLNRVLVDGGNSLSILFLKTFNQMRLSRSLLCSSWAPFHGIVPGAVVTPVGQIALPVTFET
jgi:hypothetical protein